MDDEDDDRAYFQRLWRMSPEERFKTHSMEYDRDGVPISLERWCQLQTYDYRVVRKTLVGAVEVSTVWLGIDHGIFSDRPLIFETMLFERDLTPHVVFGRVKLFHESYDYQWRYSTEREAVESHERIVLHLRLLGALEARRRQLSRPRAGRT